MEFLLQDAILYITFVTTALCLLEVFFLANVSRFVRQQTSNGRQRAFALVDTCEEHIGNTPLFSIFYKYGMVRSVRRQESSGESDEVGPYTPMFR
ncbi:hypothetical protein CN373_06075 [Bacillus cereus]|uniref:Uncharacterized protein n=1 Tax=Bacillus cereus TaxID=1396 RepID=A0AA44TDR3_BACCE|nr:MULTISPECIES: hypothetical protein [Bacillus cereus group]EEL48632.1 hypothetical protein bcere0022_40960 [Bacillus cereus Rock3-44]PFA23272.1 hypothetical protein CN373_06075 [Bacillus cereus]PFN07961.1 hypothetical protein COJ55_09100 [Bacillus cereus]PFO83982.1 hypothetical protein COJ77_06450 [Bacillus cereus]PFR26241.1 hypothetical protein COK19_13070 [Bacillus cereus]